MRAVYKILNIPKNILRGVIFKPKFIDKNKRLNVTLYQKDFKLFSSLSNANVNLYNGNKFKQMKLTGQMMPFKIGEFVFTRRMAKNIHTKTK